MTANKKAVFGMTGGILLPACLAVFLSCAGLSSPVSKIPITRNGKMSTAVLALVERQNYIFDGTRTHTHPDGLVFYFVMYPTRTGMSPSIKQYQNFTIDGEFYWQNVPGVYDSHTVIYNEKTFEEQEPLTFARLKVKRNASAFIQKTIICGPPLPPQGIVVYPLFFGFGQTPEEFEFRFNLKDVVK